jgi:DNA transformation protein
MPNSADFVAHVLELMRPTFPATARAMFGGHGIYADGIIVAIAIDDVLYLKTDDANRGEFAAQGLEACVYVTKLGERMPMSYYRAPGDALDSGPTMEPWLRSAMGAALRSAAAKPAHKTRSLQAAARPKTGRKPISARTRR